VKRDEPYLFRGDSLHRFLEKEKAEALRAVAGTHEDVLLRESVETQLGWIVGESRIDFPVLLPDEARTRPISDEKVWINPTGDWKEVPGQSIVLEVPFCGDKRLLALRPNLMGPPDVPGGVTDGFITVTFETPGTFDPDGIMRRLGDWVTLTRRWLDSSKGFVDRFHDEIPPVVEAALIDRRTRVRTAREVEAALPIRVIRTNEPVAYNVPTRRRRAEPKALTPTESMPKEWTLATADYEEAIRLTMSWATTIERTPMTAQHLEEEDLRNLLLGMLNSHFEGSAGGELFNGRGKTDILIREGNRNVFVAECKFWGGQAKFSEAIDQLLHYLVWRDTKAAIILFVREKSFGAIVQRARASIEAHPQHGSSAKSEDPTRRSDYKFVDADDSTRTISLALLPVSIRGPETKA
jgi:hypothetical protein